MKISITLIALLLATTLSADFSSSMTGITSEIKVRMQKGKSWQKGCPVGLKDLRYIRVKHWTFDGKSHMGELIMHRAVSSEMIKIFEELYEIKYPIKKMRLVSDYQGNDWQSIEADNTSAFNCRKATGSKKWSKHAYGRAIDINPIENPYISRKGYISHKASQKYRDRKHRQFSNSADRAVLLGNDKATRIFKNYGWKWGGDWSSVKDYQHFSKP